MVSLLKQAILAESSEIQGAAIPEPHWTVDVMTTAELPHLDDQSNQLDNVVLCPLTINIPDHLPFAAHEVYRACRDIAALRQQVQQWQYATGSGDLWLPIVQTAKGAIYAEAIELDAARSRPSQNIQSEQQYRQPVHLTDRWRQPLYNLGQRLLQHLAAPSAVYLLQFGIQEDAICFDRLIPFPDVPAIASLGVQTPDLFTCHWYCLTNQPIRDLAIAATNSG